MSFIKNEKRNFEFNILFFYPLYYQCLYINFEIFKNL